MNTALILAENLDPNGVTPGVVGFLITAAVAITSIFLIIDMNQAFRGEVSATSEPFEMLYKHMNEG